MSRPLAVYIGFDERETVAYHVLSQSIQARASRPVSITPLVRRQLLGIHNRERGPLESTAFSFTRFLVPYLSGYQDHALYLDCDMLVQCDVHDLALYYLANPDKAVFVVKHDYVPKDTVKMDGCRQVVYPRKNWSSVMLFNNALCKALTAEYVDRASGLDLHRFAWLPDEQIGELPPAYNWLVGEYAPNRQAKILHYTLGGPWMAGYETCDHSDDWRQELHAATTGACCAQAAAARTA